MFIFLMLVGTGSLLLHLKLKKFIIFQMLQNCRFGAISHVASAGGTRFDWLLGDKPPLLLSYSMFTNARQNLLFYYY